MNNIINYCLISFDLSERVSVGIWNMNGQYVVIHTNVHHGPVFETKCKSIKQALDCFTIDLNPTTCDYCWGSGVSPNNVNEPCPVCA